MNVRMSDAAQLMLARRMARMPPHTTRSEAVANAADRCMLATASLGAHLDIRELLAYDRASGEREVMAAQREGFEAVSDTARIQAFPVTVEAVDAMLDCLHADIRVTARADRGRAAALRLVLRAAEMTDAGKPLPTMPADDAVRFLCPPEDDSRTRSRSNDRSSDGIVEVRILGSEDDVTDAVTAMQAAGLPVFGVLRLGTQRGGRNVTSLRLRTATR